MADNNDSREEEHEFESFDDSDTENPSQTEEAVEQSYEDDTDDALPEKYRDKEVKDIVAMHQNAEKLLGKQSQEVGELRRVVDDFIQSQTVAKQEQAQAVEDDLDDLDFFENPKEAVRKLLDNHPSVQQSKQMAVELAKQETMAKLKSNHPDFTSIVNDPAFGEWVSKSKVRTKLLQQADKQFDYDSADELFSLWKERQGMVKSTVKQERTARKQAVKKASTGNTRGSSERSSKKVYRRADIVELMTKDPQRYQALAEEIRNAYAEGRVK